MIDAQEESDRGGGDAGECAAFGSGSFEIAMLAAGAGITAVDKVMQGELDNAYVLCRPPGHHAEADRGRGFCIFNNIAIAAHHVKHARNPHLPLAPPLRPLSLPSPLLAPHCSFPLHM